MKSYYYLMAQLPYLNYEQKPYMSSVEFKEFAKPFLTEEDAEFLQYVSLDTQGNKTDCKFINSWRDWENCLRLNLARGRAAKIKRDLQMPDPPSHPADAAAAAAKVLNTDVSPLAAEILLDNIRWNAIDSLAGYDYFSRDSVYAYALKLMLLERRQLFDAEAGFAEYKALYSSIEEKARASAGSYAASAMDIT